MTSLHNFKSLLTLKGKQLQNKELYLKMIHYVVSGSPIYYMWNNPIQPGLHGGRMVSRNGLEQLFWILIKAAAANNI